MAKKLYVGGLSYNTTDDTLKDSFSQAGTVASATIIIDRMSGRSKGFGFVEMTTDAEAEAAIEMWNGKELDGRTLTVNEARPMEARPPRRDFNDRGGNSGGGRGGFGGGRRDSNW
jgi:RNA recognition motif-containing protein